MSSGDAQALGRLDAGHLFDGAQHEHGAKVGGQGVDCLFQNDTQLVVIGELLGGPAGVGRHGLGILFSELRRRGPKALLAADSSERFVDSGICYVAAAIPKQPGNRGRTLMQSVSDILIMTLSLLAGVVGCLARPCKPEDWAYVKAARVQVEAMPASVRVADFEPAPVSEPGFADGLTAVAA